MSDPLAAVPTVKTPTETWVPTVQMGFLDGVLCQGWISTLGNFDWRPLPTVEPGKPAECVAGFVEDDPDET